MSESAREIRCMLIPLHGEERLLVPNAAVVEIIGYRDPVAAGWTQPWVQGTIKWHQHQVPVIDFENIDGEAGLKASIRQRIVVCYSPDETGTWPLVGFVSQGIPRLVRVSEELIDDATEGPSGESAIQMRLRIGDDNFIVPDLAYLMGMLRESAKVAP